MENDNLIQRLYSWAEDSVEPLRSYATGLLGAAMDVQDIAIGFRENNARLVPMMLRRLHALQAEDRCNGKTNESIANGLNEAQTVPVPNTSEIKSRTNSIDTIGENSNGGASTSSAGATDMRRPFARFGTGSAPGSPEQKQNGSLTKFRNTINLPTLFENSSHQSWAEKYTRYSIPIWPATSETYQMLALRYLASLGEYQEFLGQVFEHNALQLIFRYIDCLDPRNTCLTFEALKYLASLLCHKKFSLEFINNGGLEVSIARVLDYINE